MKGYGMNKTILIIIICLSISVGLSIPLVVDYALFGTITPCHTVKVYEDGSSFQACEVKQ